MRLVCNDCLKYELPKGWCAEEGEDNLLLYDPDGFGAMVLSFFIISDKERSLDKHMIGLANNFINRNNIKLQSPIILLNNDDKEILSGTGITFDGWFVKLWVIAKKTKIVFVTYNSKNLNDELKVCDLIVDSIQILV